MREKTQERKCSMLIIEYIDRGLTRGYPPAWTISDMADERAARRGWAAGSRGEGREGESDCRVNSRRSWRFAGTVMSATACAAAVILFLAADHRAGEFRVGADVLLSAGQRDELREARSLRRVHASYDRAKLRLERMSTEYTDLGVRLQAAQTRASSLRTELENKMREIRQQFHPRNQVELRHHSAQGFTMSLAEAPPREERAARLEHEVAVLKATVRHMGRREAEQATELQQLRQQEPAAGAWEEGADVRRFPRRPILGFRAERLVSREKLAALAHLQSINIQLDAENRRICELCAQSALLRANRQRTCGICAQHAPGEVRGDTDVEPFSEQQQQEQKTGEGSLVGEAMSLFMPAMTGEKAQATLVRSEMQRHQLQPEREQQGQTAGSAGWPRDVGDIVARAAAISAARNGGADAGVSASESEGSHWDAPKDELVQIDDASHMGTPSMEGTTMTAFVTEGSTRYVVGKCAPSADELKFSAWETICDSCKSLLGSDVEALGHKVQCTRV